MGCSHHCVPRVSLGLCALSARWELSDACAYSVRWASSAACVLIFLCVGGLVVVVSSVNPTRYMYFLWCYNTTPVVVSFELFFSPAVWRNVHT